MKRFISLFLFLLMLSLTFTAFADGTWDCPECGRTGNTGNFCGGCGAAAPVAGNTAGSGPVPGNTVFFGSYEQDANSGNGAEPIEWIVLDVQDGKALLLSRYGLEVKPYHRVEVNITWEECSLRSWLNGDFLIVAFSDAEQSAILLTDVDNSVSQGYSGWDTPGGNDTQDRVFLLSYAEANAYLAVTYDNNDNITARVAPTAYTISHDAVTGDSFQTADGESAGWWWLRSPGNRRKHAARVGLGGSLLSASVNLKDGVIRPALWVDLNADIF